MPQIRVERIDPDRIATYRTAWRDLIDRCLEPNVFSEPAFVLAATRHLALPRTLVFLTAWIVETDQLVGLCAVVNGLGAASIWSHPQATAAFPLLDKTYASAAFGSFLADVANFKGRPRAVVLRGLPVDGPTSQLAMAHSAQPLEPRLRAILRRGGAPSPSGKARKEMRRQWNRLSELGALATCSGPATGPALDAFLDLEARGWKGKQGTAFKSQRNLTAFLQALTQDLAAEGRCRVDRLMLDGQCVAAGIFLASGDRAYFWKTAYDESYARYSPGVQLVLALTRTQVDQPGVTLTDSCAISGHTMIERLWPDRLAIADYLVPTDSRPNAPFRTIVSALTFWRRLRSRLKAANLARKTLRTPTKV